MNDQSSSGSESSERAAHPEYKRTSTVRIRLQLDSGVQVIGDLHVEYPDGRVSDVLNDGRAFIPLTNVVMEGDTTSYDFLTVAKDEIALVYEIRH